MSVPAALHGWHARPGTSSSLPTTAEQALSQCWQRIDQLPCVPESRTALFVVPSGSSPFCTSLTATRERKQRAKNAAQLCLPFLCSKARMVPCDARGERSGTYGCPCALRARTAVCGPSHRAARCSRALSAATANLTSRLGSRDATTLDRRDPTTDRRDRAQAPTAIMKLALAFLGATAVAFTAPQTTSTRAATQLCAYVPSGMDPAAYAALKKKEAAASKKSDRKAYKSRSFNSFVEAMEKGEATHLFAVDPRKIKSGEVPIEEVPYMQRAGGSWDGSDLKGAALRRAKKKQSQGMYTAGKWLDSDREYEKNGPGVMSFFTQFNGGKQDKVEDRARQNGISQDAQLWRDAGALSAKQASKIKASKLGEEKKFFGLF